MKEVSGFRKLDPITLGMLRSESFMSTLGIGNSLALAYIEPLNRLKQFSDSIQA